MNRLKYGSRRLDRDMTIERPQAFGESDDLPRYHRLASRDHYVPRWIDRHFGNDAIERKLVSFRRPRRVRGVAPGAAQIAPAGAHEHGRNAHQRTLALYRIEDLSDLQDRPLRSPCAGGCRHHTVRTVPPRVPDHSNCASIGNRLPARKRGERFHLSRAESKESESGA